MEEWHLAEGEKLRSLWKSKRIVIEEAAKQVNDILREMRHQPIGRGFDFNQELAENVGDVLA